MTKASNFPKGFANGVTMRNMPVLNAYAGTVFWLDSGAGSDGNKGTFDRPFSTIDKAISMCTANNGDIIMVKPGHAENIADATTFQVDVAGVSIVGLGSGASRPTFTFTNTAGSIEIDSADAYLENLLFVASVSAVVVGMNVDAANAVMVECEWNFDATGDDFLIMADCAGVNGTEFLGCKFIAENAAGAARGVSMYASDYTKIIGNHFVGDFSLAPIYSDTTDDTGGGTATSDSIEVRDNTAQNYDTGGICIDLNNADTGVIAFNRLAGGSGGVATLIDAGSCQCIENYGSTGTDVTGVVVPTTVDT